MRPGRCEVSVSNCDVVTAVADRILGENAAQGMCRGPGQPLRLGAEDARCVLGTVSMKDPHRLRGHAANARPSASLRRLRGPGDGENVRGRRLLVGRSIGEREYPQRSRWRGHNLVTHLPKLADSGRQWPHSLVLETRYFMGIVSAVGID